MARMRKRIPSNPNAVRKTMLQNFEVKHMTFEVPSEINTMARVLKGSARLADFTSDIFAKEIRRIWEKRTVEEDPIRSIVRDEIAKAFG